MFVDPNGLKTAIIITTDKGFFNLIAYGSHSALRIDNPLGEGPVLYDPSGAAYNPKDKYGGPLRAHDTFYDEAANIEQYKAAHEAVGSIVEIYVFDTTPEEEKQIADRIDKSGAKIGPQCTLAVSEAIKGIGPFKDLGTYGLPGSLADKLKEIKRKQQGGRK